MHHLSCIYFTVGVIYDLRVHMKKTRVASGRADEHGVSTSRDTIHNAIYSV